MTVTRIAALALAASVALGCGGARKESRQGSQENARRERRTETARGQGAGERKAPEGGGAREKAPRVPASPEALLGKRTVGDLQQALAQRGLLKEHQQGEMDAPTRAAVRRFQQQQGLAATGLPDKETLRELGVSAERAYGAGSDQ